MKRGASYCFFNISKVPTVEFEDEKRIFDETENCSAHFEAPAEGLLLCLVLMHFLSYWFILRGTKLKKAMKEEPIIIILRRRLLKIQKKHYSKEHHKERERGQRSRWGGQREISSIRAELSKQFWVWGAFTPSTKKTAVVEKEQRMTSLCETKCTYCRYSFELVHVK